MSQHLRSDRVVVESPLSFTGSAKRIWHWTWVENPVAKVALAFVAVTAILFMWTMILCWYLIFGLLVVPWRLVRRGSRRDKAARLRHHEMMNRPPGP